MDDYLDPNGWWLSSPSDEHASIFLAGLDLSNESKWDCYTSEQTAGSALLTQAAFEDCSEDLGASTSSLGADSLLGLIIPTGQPFAPSPSPINIALSELQYGGRISTTEGSESALSSHTNTLYSGSPSSSSRWTVPLQCGGSDPPSSIYARESDRDINRIPSTVREELGFGRFSLRSSPECRPARRKLGEEERTRAAKVRRVGACEKCRQGKRKCRHALEFKERCPSRVSRRLFHEKHCAERSYNAQQNSDDNIMRALNYNQSTPQPIEDPSGARDKSRKSDREKSAQDIRFDCGSPKEPKGEPFHVPKDPKKPFCRGRVFEVPWSEGTIVPSFRTFVIFRWKGRHSICFPVDQIKTCAGVIYNERALLYAGNEPTDFDAAEARCKIRVEEENLGALVENSMINFGKVYTVEHNIKSRIIGQVAPSSLKIFDACATLSLEV